MEDQHYLNMHFACQPLHCFIATLTNGDLLHILQIYVISAQKGTALFRSQVIFLINHKKKKEDKEVLRSAV